MLGRPKEPEATETLMVHAQPSARLTVLEHSARTALVAMASLLVARFFRLQESYWAPITTLVITQSTLGAAFAVSWQRFVGTILGALVGGFAASCFAPRLLVFGSCVLILGLLYPLVRADRSAYRFAGVALCIVLLVPRSTSAWRVALDRAVEVSIGIAVALLFAIVWPEGEEPSSGHRVSGP